MSLSCVLINYGFDAKIKLKTDISKDALRAVLKSVYFKQA